MNIQASYFSITNPLHIADRWLNPFKYTDRIYIDGQKLHVEWTSRAEKALRQRESALIVEMQLYFTCVVKKRLIFHECSELETATVNDKLELVFRPVEATSCNPVEFARHYPVKQTLTSRGATRMHPSRLQLDFRNGEWQGTYMI